MWRSHIDFFILISITILFIPFFGLSSTIDPVLMPRFCVWGVMSFILLVSLLITLCRAPSTIDCSIIRRMIFPALLGYLLFSLISLTKALNITEGIYEILKISVSIVYLFLATIILSKNRNYIPILIKTIIVAATVFSLIGFYEYFTFGFGEPGLYKITGTMAQKNQFSSALFLMLPFCLYAVLCFRNYFKFLSIIPTTLILTMILLNQTRSVWLGMFVSTVVTTIVVGLLLASKKLIISRETKILLFRRFLYIAAVLIVAGTVFGYLYLRAYSIDSLVDRVASIFSTRHGVNVIRISMWRRTLELVKDNFILGVGAGNWKVTFPSYGIDNLPDIKMFKTTFFVRPENDYLWVLSETGIFGFIFYLSVFAIVISYTIKIVIQSSSSNDKLLAILIFSGIVGYMTISFFTFPKERIFHSMFLMLMMAIVTSVYHKSFSFMKNVSRQFMLTLAAPFLLLLVFAIIVGYIRLKAEIHTKRALAARRVQNWPMVVSEIDKGYSVFATLDPTSTPLQWYRGEANYLLNNNQKALEDFKKAYRAHPYHIHVLNNLATCYELEGDHERAILYYKKALEIHSEFEDALINLGATYYNSGRYEQAYETLLRCDQNRKNPTLERYLEAVKEKLH